MFIQLDFEEMFEVCDSDAGSRREKRSPQLSSISEDHAEVQHGEAPHCELHSSIFQDS